MRFQDGFIEVVVKLPEDGDEALVVDDLVLGVQGFAGTDFLEDVVNAGEREVCDSLSGIETISLPSHSLSMARPEP